MVKYDYDAWGNHRVLNGAGYYRISDSLYDSLKNIYYDSMLDTIGPAYCIDIGYLNSILKGIWYF